MIDRSPLRPARLHAGVLADELRERIARERIESGSRLGSEQEIIGWSGRSRATVREALRLLSEQGLVHTRPGPNGGVFVARPGPERVAKSLGILLEASQVSLAELLEARLEIESSAVGIASRRSTSEDISKLQASCERLTGLAAASDGDRAVDENLAFHDDLVAASHNTVLIMLHQAIRDLIRVSTVEPAYTPDVESEVVSAHEHIVEALRHRDSEAATRRIRRHLEAFESYLRTTNQYELLKHHFRF